MYKFVAVLGIVGLASLGTTTTLTAQAQSSVSGSELESAVVAAPGSNQAAVQGFLHSERVTGIANGMGVSTEELSNRVSTMDEVTLSDVAARTRAGQSGLAGGDQTIVLGTTAILLIIIIIILLAN